MAIPVVQSFTSNTDAGSSSLTLTKPASVAVGDLLLIIVGNDDNSNNPQWDDATLKPSGFTLINEAGNATSDAHTAAFWRVADGSEGATINVPAQSNEDYWGFYIRVTGTDQSAPICATGADNIIASSSSHPISDVTTPIDDCLAFYQLCFDGHNGDPFSVAGAGWSESAEIDIDPGGMPEGSSGCWGTKDQASAGATGIATVTSNSSDGSASFQFAIGAAEVVINIPTATMAQLIGQSTNLVIEPVVIINIPTGTLQPLIGQATIFVEAPAPSAETIMDLVLEVTGGSQINDALHDFYHARGAMSHALVDAEYEFLIAQGISAGHKNDMWWEFFNGIVSVTLTGTLSDMRFQWWKAGAPLT